MDETYIMNDVKESCCYVSVDFKKDLELSRYVMRVSCSIRPDLVVDSQNPNINPIIQEYVLPDFSTNRRGRIRKPDEILEDSHQVLYMNNERFAVPEILFRPDDIGEPTQCRSYWSCKFCNRSRTMRCRCSNCA